MNEIENIVKIVKKHSKVDITKGSRKQHILIPRYIAFRIAKEVTEYSLGEIGLKIGNYDHASVLHGVKRSEYFMRKKPLYRALYKHCLEVLEKGSSSILQEATTVDQLKDLYHDELDTLRQKHKEEINLIRSKSLLQEQFYSELLELSLSKQKEFYENRTLPFLRMCKADLMNIEVKLEKVG